jgi:hypothetical protein
LSDLIVESLIVDFLEWLLKRDRTYEEAINVWRTSCPRLPVWEDAHDHGFVGREEVDGRCLVRVTPSGLAFLHQRHQKSAESRKV